MKQQQNNNEHFEVHQKKAEGKKLKLMQPRYKGIPGKWYKTYVFLKIIKNNGNNAIPKEKN